MSFNDTSVVFQRKSFPTSAPSRTLSFNDLKSLNIHHESEMTRPLRENNYPQKPYCDLGIIPFD
jgi:hypothetical protein